MRRRKSDQREQSRAEDSPQPGRDAIAQRAFELYEQRGGEHGRDRDDWFHAENELRQQAEARANAELDADTAAPARRFEIAAT